MAVIEKINISQKSGGDTYYVESAYLEKDKGIRDDRYYNNFKEKKDQITLIDKKEIENFNNSTSQKIDFKDFRRNIITFNIDLNQLIGKKIKIGKNAVIYIHELCQPCLYLQNKLKTKQLVKLLVNKSGVNGEILSSGLIKKGDAITVIE